MKHTLYTELGEIKSVVDCQEDVIHLLETEGLTALPAYSRLGVDYVDTVTKQVVEKPTKPSSVHVFDYVTKQWYDPRTLQDLKDAANNSINASWDKATSAGFAYMSKEFSTTPSSRSDIDGINGYVALYNDFPQGWIGAWKAKDGQYLPITSTDEWKEFYASMVVAGLANFTKAQSLKAQVAAATTPEDVEAIAW